MDVRISNETGSKFSSNIYVTISIYRKVLDLWMLLRIKQAFGSENLFRGLQVFRGCGLVFFSFDIRKTIRIVLYLKCFLTFVGLRINTRRGRSGGSSKWARLVGVNKQNEFGIK